jgi:hypothetical protein
MVLNHLDGHTLLVPCGLAAGEQFKAMGNLHVPVQVLALDAFEHKAAARARQGEQAHCEKQNRALLCSGHDVCYPAKTRG